MKRNNKKYRLTALVFLGILAVIFLMNIIWPDKEFSEKENRMLEQRPELTLSGIESGRFMEHYESYKSDQFAGRNFWVGLKTRMDLLAGRRESNGVFKGKKHYLLEEIKTADQEQMQKNLEAIKAFQNEYQDIPMYMMLVPNAANVLSEKLPKFAVTEDQNKEFQNIRKTLGEGIVWVDAQKPLKKHKNEEIYYHTDHHWTSKGAYYAYEELAKVMELDAVKTKGLKPYAVTNTFNGTLSATSGYETGYKETIYAYLPKKEKNAPQVVVNYVDEKKKTATLYDTSKLEGKDKYAVFLGGNYAMLDIHTTADSPDKLLVLKDSYANCMLPFLTPHYREIIVIDPRYYYGNIREVMSSNKITNVLFLYNGNTFVEDNNISGVLENDKTE